jgi:hypothetical protein
MKNSINISAAGEDLLSSVDDGTNRLFINGSEIPSASWTGSGTYSTTVQGHAITVAQVADTGGNIAIRKTAAYTYELYKIKSPGALEIYPVGSIYLSTVLVDPGAIFGGTWQRIKDTFLLTAGDTYAAGSTGGEATHKLTANEMPKHRHVQVVSYSSGSTGWVNTWSGSNLAGTQQSTGEAGGDQAHNNMPPYLAVYAWERTA